MILDILSDDNLSKFDETVLRAVYNEVKRSLDRSLQEYQVFTALGQEFDPDTSEQNNIIKSIHKLIEKGLLENRIKVDYNNTISMKGMNIYLTLEGKKYIEEKDTH